MFFWIVPVLLSFDWILIIAAVIPAIALIVYVNRHDKLEKESTELLRRLVLYGVLAALLALIAERIGSAVLRWFGWIIPQGSTAYQLLLYFGVVACSEEGIKYLLMHRSTWSVPDFNCRFDGIVYAVTVSLGFALWENISYVLMYGFRTALVRAVTAIPGHACFGVFMGVWYGLARRCANAGDPGKARRCMKKAVLLPVLLHGAYDYLASTETQGDSWMFIAFVAVMFLAAFRTVKQMSQHDAYI